MLYSLREKGKANMCPHTHVVERTVMAALIGAKDGGDDEISNDETVSAQEKGSGTGKLCCCSGRYLSC